MKNNDCNKYESENLKGDKYTLIAFALMAIAVISLVTGLGVLLVMQIMEDGPFVFVQSFACVLVVFFSVRIVLIVLDGVNKMNEKIDMLAKKND